MDFIKYVNGLKVPANFQPVSFELHNRIGEILNLERVNIDALDTKDMDILNSDQIPFLP